MYWQSMLERLKHGHVQLLCAQRGLLSAVLLERVLAQALLLMEFVWFLERSRTKQKYMRQTHWDKMLVF